MTPTLVRWSSDSDGLLMSPISGSIRRRPVLCDGPVLYVCPVLSDGPVLRVLTAVAHVHGGLQRSECASSRQSQLLKDDSGPQRRDEDGGRACGRRPSPGDSWTCDTNTLFSFVVCSAFNDGDVSTSAMMEAISPERRREPALGLPAASRVLRNGRMYVDQKRGGAQKSFPVPPPHGAGRTGSPSGADHHILTFVILFFSKLNSCYLCLCPSTESRHWMQHLVAKCH